jgi:hypothetical protein
MKIYHVIEVNTNEVTAEQDAKVFSFTSKEEQEKYFITSVESLVEDDEYFDEDGNLLEDDLIAEGKYQSFKESVFLDESEVN